MTTSLVPRGRPTGPTQQQANAFIGSEIAVQPGHLQRTKRGNVDLDSDSSNFPVSQYPQSVLEDTAFADRAQVVQGQNLTGRAVQVQYSLGEKDFEFYASKQAAEELANFERWVALQFDFKSPADVDRFAKMFPEYFERRSAVLKNISDANLRYAEILLTGAQSADDYNYLWMCQTGRIPLIEGPIWKPADWFGNAEAQANMALFNPLKLFATSTAITMPTPYIPTAATGFFNPGIPQDAAAGRAVDRRMITGAYPGLGAGAAPQNPGLAGIPANFSLKQAPGAAVVGYRALLGL